MPINKSNYLNRFEKLKLQIGKDFDQLNFIHPSVEGVAVEPASETPNDGTRYIVGDYNSTGKGKSGTVFENISKNYIAEYDSRLKSWTFFKPYMGMEVIDKGTRYLKKYIGTQWTNYMSFSVSDGENISANASSANELSTPQDFSITGGVVSNTVSFNGSNPVELEATVNYAKDYGDDPNPDPGVLLKKYGGTGNESGLASGLEDDIRIYLDGIIFAEDSDNTTDFTSDTLLENNVYKINVTNLNLPNQEQINNDSYPYAISGQLPTPNGGTGRTDGKALGLYPPVNLKIIYGNDENNVLGELNENNRIGNGSNEHLGDGTCLINLSEEIPVELHYTPSSSDDDITYRRVAIDSKGHVITSESSSSQYTKTSSFTTLSNIYDIKNTNTFVCVVKSDGTITDFGNNPGYISYYTRPFIFFNDSNIYIPTSGTLMTISCNINFTGLYRTGGSVSIAVHPTQHYFDILLSNNSDLSNCMSETSTSNTNYMNLIKSTPTSTSSTFLNNCYSVFGTSNSSLSNCGINMYNMITNFLMYDGDVTQDHTGYAYYYTSIFNYSKQISKNSNIDFSKPVYGIIKISKPTAAGSNDINISWNTSSEYPAGGSSGSWDYGHVLRLVTPRIDFEYNSK